MSLAGSPDWLPNVRPQADYDVLYNQNVDLHTTSQLHIGPLDGIYQSIVVFASPPSTFRVSVDVANHTLGQVGGPPVVTYVTNFEQIIGWLPFFNVPNDTLYVNIAATVSVTTNTPITVLGLRLPCPAGIRPDGRPEVQGNFVAHRQDTIDGTLIPAPGGIERILLESIELQAGLATTGHTEIVNAQVNQQGSIFYPVQSQSTSAFVVAGNFRCRRGLLLDPNTAVTIINNVGANYAQDYLAVATYDIVV